MQLLRNLFRSRRAPEPVPDAPTQPEAAPAQSTRLEVGWATDVGIVRAHNEDAVLVITAVHDGDESLPPFGLFALADGMGGHQSGEVASSLATRAVAHSVIQRFYLPILISHEHDTGQPALQEVLGEAVQDANRLVAEQVPGGGTTLTCALMVGARVYIAHVGDSRAYVVTGTGLDQITHDHSLVDRLVELGQLTPAEAANHPQKNVLYRAVGQGGVLEVDTYMRAIAPGGQLLLCSDGLWGFVSEQEMVDIVTSAPSPQAACKLLVAAANRAGGRDNITAILVKPPSD